MEECLNYFRRALRDPASVAPWSEWWAANVERVQEVFPLIDYVRLKHRRLNGARQILHLRGEFPVDFEPGNPLLRQSCIQCGERLSHSAGAGGGLLACPICGVVLEYSAGRTQ